MAESLEHIINAVEYIESRLSEPFDLDSIAFHSTYSRFHFQRLFHACVGFTVFEYIRRRRLSEAARTLLRDEGNSPRKIIDVAIDLGFGSHAGFTRNFREYFGASPAEYRRQGGSPVFGIVEACDRERLAHFHQLRHPPPGCEFRILNHPEILLACAPAVSTDQREILTAWKNFSSLPDLRPSSNNTESARFAGLIEYASIQSAPIDFAYSPGRIVEKDQTVKFLEQYKEHTRHKIIPGGDFLILTHRGSVTKLPDSFFYAFGPLMARLKRTSRAACDLEIYDSRFRSPDDPDNQIELWIPIEPIH